MSNKLRFKERSLARLCAVKALYVNDKSGQAPKELIKDFKAHDYYLSSYLPIEERGAVDGGFFEEVISGVITHHDQITALLRSVLTQNWSYDRLDQLIRHVFEAAIYELLYEPEIDIPVIINEYLEVTYAFFNKKESGFVNGVLHDLAKKIRGNL